MTNDRSISALVLTIGEATYQKAYDSLSSQTAGIRDIIVVKNVSPFSAAFNEGVSRIKTDYFVQCDADMVLDQNCVEMLMSRMGDRVGLVIGYLRDPIQGRTQGVKLYRTKYAQKYLHRNSSDCELEFANSLILDQVSVVVIEDLGVTLGSHRTDLSDSIYNFERFKLLGIKFNIRHDWWDLTNRLLNIYKSGNDGIIPQAIAGIFSGVYINNSEDHLKRFDRSKEYKVWKKIESLISNKDQNIYLIKNMGESNYVIGYWHGWMLRTCRKRIGIRSIISHCLESRDYVKLSYLAGFYSALISSRHLLPWDCYKKYMALKPLLEYWQQKISTFY